MLLPPSPEVSQEIYAALAGRHHLGARTLTPLPAIGICNAIYAVGADLILRIPRDAPPFIDAARREAITVPIVRAIGLSTPAIVAFDDTCAVLPVPYTLYERVPGRTLGVLDLDPEQTPDVWRALGRELALLHTSVRDEGPLAAFQRVALPDIRGWPDDLARDGYFTGIEARWFSRWLDRLAPAALQSLPERFLHHDIQATNVMVQAQRLVYVALLDWGDAGWGDVAKDGAGIPLAAVPYLLAGHREVAPLDDDATAEARVLYRQLQLALHSLRRPPQPAHSWAERPLGHLLAIVRFLTTTHDPRWRELLWR